MLSAILLYRWLYFVHPFTSWRNFGVASKCYGTINKDTVNACMGFYINLSLHFFSLGIVGSHGNHMFNFKRNCQNVFQNSCTILHSYHQCIEFWFLYILRNHSNVYIMVSHWFLTCSPPMTNDIEHLFMCMCIFAIWISSLVNCLFKAFPILYWITYFLIVFQKFFIYFWYKLFVRYMTCKYFLQSVVCLSILFCRT